MTSDPMGMTTATGETTVSKAALPSAQVDSTVAYAPIPITVPLLGTGNMHEISQWSSQGLLYVSVAELPPDLTDAEVARLRTDNPQPPASDDPATSEYEQD